MEKETRQLMDEILREDLGGHKARFNDFALFLNDSHPLLHKTSVFTLLELLTKREKGNTEDESIDEMIKEFLKGRKTKEKLYGHK